MKNQSKSDGKITIDGVEVTTKAMSMGIKNGDAKGYAYRTRVLVDGDAVADVMFNEQDDDKEAYFNVEQFVPYSHYDVAVGDDFEASFKQALETVIKNYKNKK